MIKELSEAYEFEFSRKCIGEYINFASSRCYFWHVSNNKTLTWHVPSKMFTVLTIRHGANTKVLDRGLIDVNRRANIGSVL